MNHTLLDGLDGVLRILRLDHGLISRTQADIVAQAITEIERQDSCIKRLLDRIEQLNDLAEERIE